MPTRPRTYLERMRAGSVGEDRPSAARRGYGWKWAKLRRSFLTRHPLCVDCTRRDIVEPATEVDHIRPLRDGGTNDWSNLQPLCKSCHSRKTAIDVAARRVGRECGE